MLEEIELMSTAALWGQVRRVLQHARPDGNDYLSASDGNSWKLSPIENDLGNLTSTRLLLKRMTIWWYKMLSVLTVLHIQI